MSTPSSAAPIAKSITLGRALHDERGAFVGLVTATLSPAHFDTLLKSVLYTADMRAALVQADGRLVARVQESQIPAGVNQVASSGAFIHEHLRGAMEVSVIEHRVAPSGEERLTVFQTLRPAVLAMDRPWVIVVSRDRAAIFSGWRRDALVRVAALCAVLGMSALGLRARQRRQQAFRHSEGQRRLGTDQLRLLFDQDLGGLTITSPQKGWIRINACLCRMLEYSEPELRSMTWVQLTHPDDLARDEEQFARMARGDIEGYRLEKRFLTRSGKAVPTELVVGCVRKPGGELELVTAMVQDISERKQAQAKLLASQERYRAMIEWTPEPIIVHTDAVINYANAAAVAMFGAASELDLIGRDVFDLVHPDFHGIVRRRAKNMTDSAVHLPMIEERLIRLDGAVIDVEVHSTSIGGAGTTVHVAMRDITERKQREAALLESEHRWRLALESAGDGMWDWHVQSDERYYSPSLKRLYGYAEDEDIGAAELASSRTHPDDMPQFQRDLQAHLDGTTATFSNERRVGCKDGSWKWVLSRGMVISRDAQGKPLRMTGTHIDITQRRGAEEKIRLAASVFANAREGIAITDAAGLILDVNETFTQITGYSRDEVIGQNPRMLKSGRQNRAYYESMWRELQHDGHWSGELWSRRKSGEDYAEWLTIGAVSDDRGIVRQYVALFSDISERKRMEEQVRQLAFYDTLTGLANRRLLSDRLVHAMAASKRSALDCALMFLDLDNFKSLNDRHGHSVGDLLLREVAQRLRSCVREVDTVARFGGDEFVVIVGELAANRTESRALAVGVAEKIRVALAQPYRLLAAVDAGELRQIEHHCTASIGVVVCANHDSNRDDLLKRADAAMYQAKRSGGNSICADDTVAV